MTSDPVHVLNVHVTHFSLRCVQFNLCYSNRWTYGNIDLMIHNIEGKKKNLKNTEFQSKIRKTLMFQIADAHEQQFIARDKFKQSYLYANTFIQNLF